MKKTVYVGPTIIGVATRNTTYEELPKPLKAAIRQFPYLGNLCVPVSGLAGALAKSSNLVLHPSGVEELGGVGVDDGAEGLLLSGQSDDFVPTVCLALVGPVAAALLNEPEAHDVL